jgi:hypothetical protein
VRGTALLTGGVTFLPVRSAAGSKLGRNHCHHRALCLLHSLASSDVLRWPFIIRTLIMNTRSDPASMELNAINALFQEIWAMQRKKRQASPRGAESLLEEIAERVRDCMERRLTPEIGRAHV